MTKDPHYKVCKTWNDLHSGDHPRVPTRKTACFELDEPINWNDL